ncbi:MAG: Sensor histidine kinase RcsC [Ignavibacteriaceae bacterium]|nr:Sensor histidine kinase RcsC [Ignavibacteriaceae bacterium]
MLGGESLFRLHERNLLFYYFTLNKFTKFHFHLKHYTGLFKTDDKALIYAIITDISERVANDKRMQLFAFAIEESPVAIMISSADFNIQYVNKKFSELYGYDYADVFGQHVSILSVPDAYETQYSGIRESLENNDGWIGTVQLKRKNEKLLWADVVMSVHRNVSGNVQMHITYSLDVSDRVKMVQELIDAKNKAEEMVKLKSDFLAAMSHELRTPFIGIMGSAEVLRDELENEDLSEFADIIFTSAKRMQTTLEKILLISDLDHTDTNIRFRKVDLRSVFSKIISENRTIAEHKGLTFEVNLNFEGIEFISDQDYLLYTVGNIIQNAVIYTQVGKVKITGEAIKVNSESGISITVSDTGIGIPEDKQHLIWEEFRQISEGQTRNYEGTGLGLAIAKRCIEKLKGTISLKSTYGVGSEFTIKIPSHELDEVV